MVLCDLFAKKRLERRGILILPTPEYQSMYHWRRYIVMWKIWFEAWWEAEDIAYNVLDSEDALYPFESPFQCVIGKMQQ